MDARCFEFGPFVLIPQRQVLLKSERPVRIGSRALDLLTQLVQRPGEVIDKLELIALVWAGTFVDESNLKVNIAAIRKVIDDDVVDGSCIATVVGRGYRFVEPVRELSLQGFDRPASERRIERCGSPKCFGPLSRVADETSDGSNQQMLPEDNMPRQYSTLTLAEAKQILARAEAKAEGLGIAYNIAVVDAGGHLVAFSRQDGALIGSIDLAIDKALTARIFEKATSYLAILAQSGKPLFGIQESNEGKVVIFGGGIPITLDGNIIGAVGASAGTVEQDIAVAEAGAAALSYSQALITQ
jgi:uncharacterized protein GlcG (DUF336 family)/DNA-binding winged helix-turn-helix (wHTH) protein